MASQDLQVERASAQPPVRRMEDISATEKELRPQTVGGLTAGPAPPPERQAVDADTAITYLYLTFATPLPYPHTTGNPAAAPPPPPPDLTPFADPRSWPENRKRVLLVLSCVATFLTAYAAGGYSPPSHIMASYFGVSQIVVLVGITTFCLGFALPPMILAPFSEINGRYPVFAVSGVVFVIFQMVCGVVPSVAGMIVARFFVGAGGSVFSTMIGGVIADMWGAEGRNTPMAVYSGSVLVGTGAGPLIAAVMTNRLASRGHYSGWDWIFWHQVIMGSVLMVALLMLFKESRGSVLLSRKAKALNKWYAELEDAGYYGVWMTEEQESGRDSDGDMTAAETGFDEEKKVGGLPDAQPRAGSSSLGRLRRIRWLVKEDEERTSLAKTISISVYRPFHLLLTEPVVFFFSLWVAFAWAVLYLTFGSIPYVFTKVYGWDIEHDGYIFAAMIVGSVLATVVGVYQDSLLRNPQWRAENWDDDDESSSSSDDNNPPPSARSARFWSFLRRRFPVEAPESRLYFTCVTSTLLPVGLFMFGFTADPSTHWAAPAVAIGLATMGIYSVYLATFNYLADVYHMYASSALAAQSFCRNVLGGVFPLVTTALFRNLGEDRAGAVLGGIASGLTLVPWVLVFYGERIRRRSKFAMVLEKTD
ncbi:Major facilitator superfamily transporter [Pleurostoma richardsiae]|uniref:Major facilitator superfamily transporter n=1 Tax=Pleurostoma richardsiae TaxID=41990 RepID=A0AA38S4F8_9PEZI|nr:Major facilitator superfamily transporter [Pleurostoma richardsiae]